jgi:hypothetical protein
MLFHFPEAEVINAKKKALDIFGASFSRVTRTQKKRWNPSGTKGVA